MKAPFQEDYYKSGNYNQYLGRKFNLLADDLIALCPMKNSQTIIDYGCGCGGLLYEFYQRGFTRLHGTDISQWAIDHGKEIYPEIAHKLCYYSRDLISNPKDYVLMLDVLEHMPEYEANFILQLAQQSLKHGVIVRVPVSVVEGSKFVLDVSNNDRTHISCHTKKWWLNVFEECGYKSFQPIVSPTIYDSVGVMAGIIKLK